MMTRQDTHFYFYDLNEVLIDRYPAKIANYLSEKHQVSNFIFIYSEKYISATPRKIPSGSKSFYIPDLSLKRIKSLFQKYPPNSLTTIAQRIPDMLMLSIFNSESIPTFIVQHGLWSDRLRRISLPKLLLTKFMKFKHYLSYAHKISKINKLPYFSFLLELYRFLIKENIYFPESKYLNRDVLGAKTAFTFDNSWDDYYVKKYGYSPDSIVYVGNPDYMELKNIKHREKEDAACYICQTLVEDGRYSEEQYKRFLKILNDFVASEKKLYIKLHPRSRRQLYASLMSNNNIIITDEFPYCDYYIGHYSGMLAVARQCSNNVLIWNLADHHIPEYFYQFAPITRDNPSELRSFVKGEINVIKENNIHVLSDAEIQEFNPIQIIGDNIYNVFG